MNPMTCDEALPLVPGYCDGELDAAGVLRLTAHLAGCEDCAAAESEHRALSAALRRAAPYHRAPAGLRQRAFAPTRAARHRERWARWVMPLAAAVVLGIGVNTFGTAQRRHDALVDELVAGHVRSLMLAHLDDVRSSDQHTVKPWFAGKIDFAPPVHDLADAGYPLAGGRIDYIDHRPVAALDYRRRQHVINLFVWPSSETDAAPAREARFGYNLVHWTAGGMEHWAVSDVSADELMGLSAQLLAQDAQPR